VGNEEKEGPVVEGGPVGEEGKVSDNRESSDASSATALSDIESSESTHNNAGEADQNVVMVPNGHIFVVGQKKS